MNDHMQEIFNDVATVVDGKKLQSEFFRHVERVKRFVRCYERPAKAVAEESSPEDPRAG